MSMTRKELELRIEELLASEARLIARIADLEGREVEPEPRDQRGAALVTPQPSDVRGLMLPTNKE